MKKLSFIVMGSIFFVAITSIICSADYGGIANWYHVSKIRIDFTGKGIVYFNQALVQPWATCMNSGYTNAMSFDVNNSAGKAFYAMLLDAKASNSTVYAKAQNACNEYSGTVASFSRGEVENN